MSKYRQAALLIQRSEFTHCEELSGHSMRYLGFRGHLARKQFRLLKSTVQAYQNEIQHFCNSIEEINNQLVHRLNQLSDKLPGMRILDEFRFI